MYIHINYTLKYIRDNKYTTRGRNSWNVLVFLVLDVPMFSFTLNVFHKRS